MDSNLITAVGIDVSKGKSTVAIRRPGGEIVRKPFTVKHDQPGLRYGVLSSDDRYSLNTNNYIK